jgi:TonB family protein
MSVLLTALLLLWVISGLGAQDRPQPALVGEQRPRYSFKGGVHELGSSRGWLRIQQVYLNFRLRFDYRATTPATDAGVMVRTWTGKGAWPDRGYRFRVPTAASDSAAAVLVGRREKVNVVQQGRIELRPLGEWQQVEITGEGRKLTMTLNGTVVGVFDIETYGGHVLFDNSKGQVQLRNITSESTETTRSVPGNLMTFEKLKDAKGEEPKLIHEVKPSYTIEALRRGVQGLVNMEVVVLPDGSTGPVRVIRSLDPDLDLSAIAAIRAWRFKPAVLNGQGVPVLVEVEITFTLT